MNVFTMNSMCMELTQGVLERSVNLRSIRNWTHTYTNNFDTAFN